MSRSKYETEDFIAFHQVLEQLLTAMVDNEQPRGSANFESGDFSATIDITLNSLEGAKRCTKSKLQDKSNKNLVS